MASNNAATYSLRSQAKCLVPHAADQDRHGFLVGTANLRGPNEIRILRYYEDEDELDCAAVYIHENEIAGMSGCAHDAAVVLTTSTNSEGLPCASVYRMRDLPGDVEPYGEDAAPPDVAIPKSLDRLVALPVQRSGCRLLHAQFVPSEEALASGGADAPSATTGGVESCKLLAVDDTSLRLWTLRSDGSLKLSLESDLELPSAHDATFIGGAAWDSLNYGSVAVAHDAAISIWDTRSGEQTRMIERAVPSGCCVRSLSFNPNKPWHLASGGDDYATKIWDTRKTTSPVKILQGHTHWWVGETSDVCPQADSFFAFYRSFLFLALCACRVTSVAFNQFHDQLLLSGGADGRVNLWRVSSVSSAPLLELGEEEIFGGGHHHQQHPSGASAGSADGASHGGKKHEPKLAPDVAIRTTTSHSGHGHHHHHHGGAHLPPAAAALADSAAEGTQEDSVYSVCWSPGSAWIYASLSYTNGKITIGQVPSAEKYKILL
jgi:EARP and GARP complex-interacting protein 1